MALLYDPATPLEGKHILIVEDIIDSGRTMRQMLAHAGGRGIRRRSRSVPCSTSKCSRNRLPEVRWVGFPAPPAFLVGYGLDHAEDYRHLPFIGDLT